MEFLNQYQVKRMKDSEWDPDLSGEQGFWTIIRYTEYKLTMAVLNEGRLVFTNEYFKVVNGPIDMNWIENFNKKYSQ